MLALSVRLAGFVDFVPYPLERFCLDPEGLSCLPK